MSLDYKSIRQQVQQLGETALLRERELSERRKMALALLESYSQDLESLRQKVEQVARNTDPAIRCAVPIKESLTSAYPLPDIAGEMTLVAVDGSQISPDRHAEVNYAVVNVGAIEMRRGAPEAPTTSISSHLLYDEELYTTSGTISEANVALKRDRQERLLLGELAEKAEPPVVALTDGPMELWGVKGGDSEERADFQESLKLHLEALSRLEECSVVTGGYVDKPAANLVVRTLEIAMTPQDALAGIKEYHPLQGVTDRGIFSQVLGPGERSAVFAIQSQSTKSYQGSLKLHFFYLNAGFGERPYVARVEIPGWVAENQDQVDSLHAVLVEQCRMLGTRPYPYLLHRAHETAVVKLPEKEQLTGMIAQEIRRRGLVVGGLSGKQSAKNVEGRGRY